MVQLNSQNCSLVKMNSITAILIVILVVASTKASSISKASYGENCTKDVRCDSRNFLTCTNGLCECLMPDTMVHDTISGKCVALAGERCQYSTADAEKSWTEELPCISNAVCKNGICECNSNYYEVSNGTCLLKGEYGTECVSNEMCNNNKHLVCSGTGKACTCLPGRILEYGVCKILAGQSCPPEISDPDICVHGASCRNSSVCSCRSKDYFQTVNGTCEPKRGYGEMCYHDGQCVATTDFLLSTGRVEIPSFLACQDGICQCNSRITALTTDHGKTYCAKYLRQPCNRHECSQGATCDTTCKCLSSNFETRNQTCEPKRPYRSSCVNNEYCINGLRCDPVRKKCTCPSGEGFSATVNRCLIGPNNRCRSSYHSNDQEDCVPNANCEQLSSYNFQCRCVNGMKDFGFGQEDICYVLMNGTCDGDIFGEITTKQCWPGLSCRNGKCTCLYKDHQKYDPNTSKCYSLIGGPCNSTEDCHDKNAECAITNNVRQCHCKTGFSQSDRQCDIAFGQKCEQEVNPICDRYGPLECTGRKICECSDFQIYDNETLSCRGLVGAKCKVALEPVKAKAFCVMGAICKPFRGFETIFGLCECQPGWKTATDRNCSIPEAPIKENVIETDKPLKDAAE